MAPADVPGAWLCNVFHSQRGSNENLEQCNATPAKGARRFLTADTQGPRRLAFLTMPVNIEKNYRRSSSGLRAAFGGASAAGVRSVATGRF